MDPQEAALHVLRLVENAIEADPERSPFVRSRNAEEGFVLIDRNGDEWAFAAERMS